MTWDPTHDPRHHADENDELHCFLCGHNVERRHALFFTQAPQLLPDPAATPDWWETRDGENVPCFRTPPAMIEVPYPELPMHRTCASSHAIEYIWLQWRNNQADIVAARLPKKILASPFPHEAR